MSLELWRGPGAQCLQEYSLQGEKDKITNTNTSLLHQIYVHILLCPKTTSADQRILINELVDRLSKLIFNS